MKEIIAQIIGIFAMAFNVLSYQQKSQRGVILFQLFGSALFSINFFMINALMGGILNLVGIARAVVFLYKDKLKARNVGWLIGFIAVYVVSYLLTFTVFQKPVNATNLLVEFLPIIGMVATTVAFRHDESKITRKLGFISSPAWLIYNVVNFSIGAICCETLSLISIIVGTLRLDSNKEKSDEK